MPRGPRLQVCHGPGPHVPVQGLGGVFLASHEPDRLIDWFRDALGIELQRHDGGGSTTHPAGDAITVLGIQPARRGAPSPPVGDTEREPYGRQPMMLNLRVTDIEALLDRVRSAGSHAIGPEEYEGMGRFGWTRTPDGHDVELWEPA